MSVDRFHAFALVVITLVLGFLGFQVMKPFLAPLAWAGVLSILFYPVYAYFSKRVRWKSVAAVLTLIIILVIILGPFSYLTFLLSKELTDVAGVIKGGELQKLAGLLDEPRLAWLTERLAAVYGTEEADLEVLLVESLSSLGKKLMSKITAGAKNVLAALLNFVFMSLAIFFLLRDGTGFVKKFRDYLPFPEPQRERLEKQVNDMVVSTVFGGVVVALVQGIMGGTAFYFLSVPSPVIWGTAIAIMSFVPMLGTFSIWGSIVVFLFLKGAVAKGFILLLVGTFGISLVDNILKPLIIGNRTKMPTLVIFFSVLGGIKLFGLIGLIMGPMSVALFISVLGIFRNIEGGIDAEQGRY
jgi:predicted PurR-regulated permease PerM